jgi:outer membrane protein assembly factor BamB
MTGVDGEKLVVLSLDRATGKEPWRREVPRRQQGRPRGVNGPASPSPVTDGTNVYAFFQDYGLIAFTGEGKELWRQALGPFNMFYGFGASPILVDGLLILPVDQDTGSYLLAVDAKTGKQRYKVDRPGVISGYSTPTVYQPKDGGKQILVPESFQLSAYDVKDGHRVWWVRGLACEMKSVVSIDGDTAWINGWGFSQNQPRAAGSRRFRGRRPQGLRQERRQADRRRRGDGGPATLDLHAEPEYGFPAFDATARSQAHGERVGRQRAMLAAENGLLAITLGGKGDMTDGAVKWKYTRPVPQVPSTLLYNNVLFMVNDSGILISFDPATGTVLKQGRLKGAIDKYFASPVGADGKVFLVSQDGTASVVDAKGEWELLAVNPLEDEVFATHAFADGKIYIRTKGWLYAFGQPGA